MFNFVEERLVMVIQNNNYEMYVQNPLDSHLGTLSNDQVEVHFSFFLYKLQCTHNNGYLN